MVSSMRLANRSCILAQTCRHARSQNNTQHIRPISTAAPRQQETTSSPSTPARTTGTAAAPSNNSTRTNAYKKTSYPARFPNLKPSTPSAPEGPKLKYPPVETTRNTEAAAPLKTEEPIREVLTEGLSDLPADPNIPADAAPEQVDWTKSFHGLSSQPFSKEAGEVLMQPIDVDDIEIKPDGIIYLPEIKYRRILNRAFGPGGWGLAPRGETIVTEKSVTREYALLAQGRLVSIARGEQDYFDPEGIPTATEGCKSNALMRCCKDLGIASELWDPRFIRKYLKEHARDVWVEHAVTKKRKKVVMRTDDELRYPFKEVKHNAGAAGASGF